MSAERNPFSKHMMDALNAADELTRLRTELAEAKAQLATSTRKIEVLAEGLVAISDGDVAYNPMGWPEEVHYSQLAASISHARDTLARADAVGKDTGKRYIEVLPPVVSQGFEMEVPDDD